MTLRPLPFLRTQIRLRRDTEAQRLAALGGPPSLGDNPFDYYAHQRAMEQIAAMEREVATASDALELAFDGRGVRGSTIELRRLEQLIGPLGQAMRYTARDVILIDGDQVASADVVPLCEPVLAETFNGSFGIRIARSPVPEQVSFLRAPIFERTVDRFVAVFTTARDTGEQSRVIEALWGLRATALSGFRKLSETMADSGATTRMRWRDEVALAVSPSTAVVVAEALAATTASDEQITVRGVLTGGDVDDERFHLIVENPQGADKHYRGAVAANVLPTLRLMPFDSRVVAEIEVIYTESQLLPEPRETYILREVRRMETGSQ